MPVNSQNFNF